MEDGQSAEQTTLSIKVAQLEELVIVTQQSPAVSLEARSGRHSISIS
jgi:hypothetical protein